MNIANKYWNQHFKSIDTNRKETDYAYSIRNKWRELGFPSYPTVDIAMGLPENTTANYASKYNFPEIKKNYDELLNQIKIEEQEKKQAELINNFEEIWNTGINDTKYQLQQVTNEIKEYEVKLKQSRNADEELIIRQKLDYLWGKHDNILINKFPRLQDKARINLGMTNNYKDTAPDKIEMEQTGELTINNNNTGKTREELDKEYEDRFKKYIKNITQDNTDDVQDV